MTVSTEVDHNDYTGNGVTTSFPYTFRIFTKTDLMVQVVDLSENITVLTLDTDYNVTGAGAYSGGSVVLPSPLASGWQISISRELPATQETDLRNQGKFFAEVHEDAFDKLTMLIQQCFSFLRLALRKPSFIANYYDALNNRIRNLRDPSQDQDAATKHYSDELFNNAISHSNDNLNRTLRVPESYTPEYFIQETRSNMLVGCNDRGEFVPIAAQTDTADLAFKLAALTGASLIGGLGYKTPEMYGAKGDGISYDDTAIQASVNTPYTTVLFSKTYRTTTTIVPAEGVKIIGGGKIINESTQSFTWSASNRASNFPAIMIQNKNISISSIAIESTYEAIQAKAGGDNLTILLVKGGGTESKRAKSTAFVFFNVNNVRMWGCEGAYTGNLATWDSTQNRIKSGGCDGVDFGGVKDIFILWCNFHDVGRNGINWYGASNVHIDHSTERYCGQSGIQVGPHPSYNVATISNNLAEYCCADAVDIRYTGTGAQYIGLTMNNCHSNWIGMLYGDVNFIGVDGSGIATVALVKGVDISSCETRNSSGVVLWFESSSEITADNIIGDTIYSKYGVGFYTSCNNIKLSNFNIKSKGSSLWFGGSATFTDFSIGGSNYFESYDSYALLMPNNPLTRFNISNTTFVGYKICNLIFDTENVEFIQKAGDQSSVYLGTAYLSHSKLKCTGSTSEDLVKVGVGTGVRISNGDFTNTGSGSTISLVSSVNFKITMSRIWNTGSGGGSSLKITGGQNQSVIDKNDLYSVSGSPIVSLATHTDLTLANSRENGMLASSWTDKSNVYRNSRTLIS